MLTKVLIHSSNTSATLYFEDREPFNVCTDSPYKLVEYLRMFGVNLNGKAA